ncbi:hypothetical protein [Nocardiopsis ganjiahuensis]|uniref:hypothetical protein n=1 Tax=Nocardiopsis ganjiahuensis TaxID=239984 RepID=UPI0003714D7A|nr:hypothetical protein [Nocardiopsis ganjiahuensis]
MAMSGMRQVAVGLGMIQRTPPDAILREGVPAVLRRVPEHRRTAFIEFAHWGYGATAGAAFGLVPRRLRSSRLSGPVYGVLAWSLFELALAPALGLAHAQKARPQERAALLVDHVFFGLIVGSPPEAVIVEPEDGNGDRNRGED